MSLKLHKLRATCSLIPRLHVGWCRWGRTLYT